MSYSRLRLSLRQMGAAGDIRVLVGIVVIFAASCATAPVPGPAPASAPAPIGRLIDDASPMSCPGGRAPERQFVNCPATELDPRDPNAVTITRDPRQPCLVTGVSACHIGIAGPPGSYALVCRDDQGTISGPVRLVAPDSSLIAGGGCEHSVAIGAWLTWADGQLASAVAYDHGIKRGIEIQINRFTRHVTARYHESP
jgi:hypothetical protein